MVLNASEVKTVSTILKEHELVAGYKINANRSVDLLDGRLKKQFDAIGRWADGLVKLLRVWFSHNLLVYKN